MHRAGLAEAPGGDAAHLNGTPFKLRYAWRDPARLIRADDADAFGRET